MSSDLPLTDIFPFRNRARGITPIASGWDTAPTNLENITDGDFDTATGIGSTTLPSNGWLGNIDIDLGAIYNLEVRGKFGLWSDAGDIQVFVYHSTDGITYYFNTHQAIAQTIGVTSEEIRHSQVEFVRTRYLRIRFYGTAAMTGNVKIYEIEAIERKHGG